MRRRKSRGFDLSGMRVEYQGGGPPSGRVVVVSTAEERDRYPNATHGAWLADGRTSLYAYRLPYHYRSDPINPVTGALGMYNNLVLWVPRETGGAR